MDDDVKLLNPGDDIENLVELVVESWRFSRLFAKLTTKLDAGDGARYINQYRYYLKKLDSILGRVGLRIVNVEGQLYDPGMAASALNIGDFEGDDHLLVDQMLEPIIMGDEGIVRAGTVMLRKAQL